MVERLRVTVLLPLVLPNPKLLGSLGFEDTGDASL